MKDRIYEMKNSITTGKSLEKLMRASKDCIRKLTEKEKNG